MSERVFPTGEGVGRTWILEWTGSQDPSHHCSKDVEHASLFILMMVTMMLMIEASN